MPADWDRLAEELGVQPRREDRQQARGAAPPSETAAPVAADSQLSGPRAEQAAARVGPAVDDNEPTPSEIWESELSELSDPLFIDTPVSGAVDEAPVAAESEESAKSEPVESQKKFRPGRRRKRGRRKGRRPADAEPSAADAQQADLEAAEEAVDPVGAQPAAGQERTEAEASRAGDELSHKRGKRRRRRRGATRDEKKADEEVRPAEESRAGPDASQVAPEEWIETAHDASDLEEDQSGKDERSSKLSHRAIPTWEEAISLVVSRNLESRSKHPASGSSSRGRDDGRRGRKGSPGKPS